MPHTSIGQKLIEASALAACSAQTGITVEQALKKRSVAAIHRREFLRRASLSAVALAGPAMLAPWSRAGTPETRIAIVGAGLAGLTCAYRLKQAGLDSTIYEAADHLGGRCRSRRDYFADSQITEIGGELIDQGHTAIRHLAQELGLKLDNLLRAEANATEPAYFFDEGVYSFEEATADIKAIWQKLHRDLSEADYPTLHDDYTGRGWELDHMSIIDWIEETVPDGMSSRLGQLLDVAYNIEYGGESSEQSALNLLYLLGYSGQGQLRMFGPSNEKYHVRGGNDQIVTRLTAAVSNRIEPGAALAAIRARSDGTFALTLQSGLRARELTADKVVLSVPFSILRTRVDCTQAGFTALKQTAIDELGMGTNTKLHAQFTDRHWRSLGNNGDSFADTGYQATWESSRGQPGRSGILVNYTGGLIGASFDPNRPAAEAQQFLGQIEPLLPGISGKWNGNATVEHWPGYEWTRGSYSYWRVGQYTKIAGVEREQQGNCHFAGEHTSIDSQGYLNGAVESGERAAREILADLGVR